MRTDPIDDIGQERGPSSETPETVTVPSKWRFCSKRSGIPVASFTLIVPSWLPSISYCMVNSPKLIFPSDESDFTSDKTSMPAVPPLLDLRVYSDNILMGHPEV